MFTSPSTTGPVTSAKLTGNSHQAKRRRIRTRYQTTSPAMKATTAKVVPVEPDALVVSPHAPSEAAISSSAMILPHHGACRAAVATRARLKLTRKISSQTTALGVPTDL
jgi:hypothetical protein